MPVQYLLSVYQPDGEIPRPEVLAKIMQDVEAVNREMKAAGAWVFGGGLQPPKVARVARPKAGAVHITDGAFAESKEVLGGICIILAPNFDAAIEWAGKLAQATTLAIEVRPFQDRP
jgi:hypothetical protein